MPIISGQVKNHNINIARSTQNPGDHFESIQYTLTINGNTDIFPFSILFINQSWLKDVPPPSLTLRKDLPILSIREYIPFEQLTFIERSVRDAAAMSMSVTYEGDELPGLLTQDIYERAIRQIILNAV